MATDDTAPESGESSPLVKIRSLLPGLARAEQRVANIVLADPASISLHRIGLTCFAWSDTHNALTSAAVLQANDVAIGISHSGATTETVEALREARRRGATTAAITNFARSPITEVADHVLTTAVRETT